MSFTDVNEHTKKIIANKQEKKLSKFAVTTPDRSSVSLEKTFSLDSAESLLSPNKISKINNKTSFKEEIQELKSNYKTVVKEEKKENLNLEQNVENLELVEVPSITSEAVQVISALMHTQNHIVRELTEVFDKRLEKFDDIIMDLIRCKTENERLKNKVDNLIRDNYKYKKEVESFRSVIPGIYVKKEIDKTKF